VQTRAVDTVERLAAAHPNAAIAIFSHGDVIRMLVAHYAGTPLDLFQRIHVSTGSVCTVALFGGDEGGTRAALLNVNVQPELPVIQFKAPEPQPEQGAADEQPVGQTTGRSAE
jgi:probable phosphoglycerate mutase